MDPPPPYFTSMSMYHYRLFGNVLRSEVDFPELERCDATNPRWHLRCLTQSPPEASLIPLGEDVVTGDIRVRMYKCAGGLRLVFDDTGTFDISPDGAVITWYRGPEAKVTDARADLTGRVIAAALHLAGTVSLHASAVVVGGKAIGLIGVKGRGKSTLALALVRGGARLLTDDTLPVRPCTPPEALPGLHATRLWPDSASRVGLGEVHSTAPGEKLLYSQLPADDVTNDPAPLDALYLLAPAKAPIEGSLVARTPLPIVQAALAMVGHSKLAPLLRQGGAAELMKVASDLAASIPVYRLDIVRDLDRLDEVVETLVGWHVPASAGAVTAS